MDSVGIYIHIPFCKSKCAYCDFNSYADRDGLQLDYILALTKEIRRSPYHGRTVDTIYIGGGTPSTLMPGAISTILAELRTAFVVLDNAEITIEANPNSIDLDKAMQWRSVGINRVSLGLQTTSKAALKVIGRTHTKDDYINAIRALQAAGFNNINTDLMIGLPKQKSSDVKYAVELCAKLGTTHISCYSLILEEGTRLYRDVTESRVRLPKEAKTLGMYKTAQKCLELRGYKRYEVSNFAKAGYECLHNLHCWDMQKYIGFGAGAHSYVDSQRYSNEMAIEQYISSISNDQSAVVETTNCTREDMYDETIMLGLRKANGVEISRLDCLLGESFAIKYTDAISKYTNLGMIEISHGRIKVTDRGVYVLNHIILDFIS